MSAKARAFRRRAVLEAINSSSEGGYGLALAFAMSGLRRPLPRNPDAMSLGREGTPHDACAPAVGVVEGLRHLLAVPSPQLREILRAADLQHALGGERAIVRPFAVVVQVELTERKEAPRENERQGHRSQFHERLLLHRGEQ